MELLESLRNLIHRLRREKREQYHRHVSVGDLLTDRWEIARDYGFGEGTSCYDNVLILGNVKVGRNCWIGPNVVLDGSGGELSIGDQVDISAGVHIYTHDTVQRAISGGVASAEYAPTRIGSCVYIGPHSVIQKGVRIGDGVVIGAMSLVNRDVPSNSKVWEYRLLQNRPLVSKNLRNCWRSSCGRRFNGWRRPVYAGRSETRDLG
jgi:acetyltransferase-like isoleucine patch superfamily enzyme